MSLVGTLSKGGNCMTMDFQITIINSCLTAIYSAPNIDDKLYLIGTGSSSFTFTEFTENLGFCGPFTYRATYNNGLSFPITGILDLDSGNKMFLITAMTDRTLSGTTYTI